MIRADYARARAYGPADEQAITWRERLAVCALIVGIAMAGGVQI